MSKIIYKQRLYVAMAYSRNTFKDRIEEHLGAALVHYYKTLLAKIMGKTDWVQHWETEVTQFLETSLVLAYTHPISGFKNRDKAFDEVVRSLEARNHTFITISKNTIKGIYHCKLGDAGIGEKDFKDLIERAKSILTRDEFKEQD